MRVYPAMFEPYNESHLAEKQTVGVDNIAMFRLPFSPVETIVVASWPELAFPTTTFTAECFPPDVHRQTNGQHWKKIMALPDEAMSGLNAAYITSYEVKTPLTAYELKPSARAALGDSNPAAVVYDAAIARGFLPLGIAPAKQAFKLPGNPQRVYAGPHRPHLQPLSMFSPDS